MLLQIIQVINNDSYFNLNSLNENLNSLFKGLPLFKMGLFNNKYNLKELRLYQAVKLDGILAGDTGGQGVSVAIILLEAWPPASLWGVSIDLFISDQSPQTASILWKVGYWISYPQHCGGPLELDLPN